MTDRVVHTAVRNQNDALNLLFDAAVYEKIPTQSNTAGGQDDGIVGREQAADDNTTSEGGETIFLSVDSPYKWCMLRHPLSRPSQQVLDVWKACPFVRQKWLTAQEAVTYVDLFFDHMAPMSPILDDYFCDHADQRSLLIAEPVLCSTILALSTRYHLLSGVASLSGGFYLHERLWRYCQSMLQEVGLGQGRRIKDSKRTVGTIESFLLLTEWHPRSLISVQDWTRGDSGLDWPGDEEPCKMKSLYSFPVSLFFNITNSVNSSDRLV